MTRPDILIVMTSLPDPSAAEDLAGLLVERRLAACVTVLAPCRSVYRWQGATERADEVPLLIKTTAARYAALEACIRAHHPYELPEIVAFAARQGLPEFLAWVDGETACVDATVSD